MSKYDEMKEHYEKRVEDLKKEVEHWRDKYIEAARTKYSDAAKIEMYEKVLNKLFDGPSKNTDEIIRFEGKTYRTHSFSLNREPNCSDTLTVECVSVDVPRTHN